MNFHRELTTKEEIEFRQWARENYIPKTLINPLWHPIVVEECIIINKEHHEHNEN